MSESVFSKDPFDEILAHFVEAASLSEYAKDFDATKEAYSSARPFGGDGIANISDSLQRVIFEQMFFNLLTAAKLKYIYRGASDCFKTNNVVGLAYFARAILEHTAAYAYAVKKSESTIEKLSGQNNPRQAADALKALSASFHVSYYGSGDRNDQTKSLRKPIHIHDAIKALDEYFEKIGAKTEKEGSRLDQHSFLFQEEVTSLESISKFGVSFDPFPQAHVVRADYDFLCDFVHPNYGSNFLVTTGTLSEGLIDTPNDHIRNLNMLFVKKCLRYWIYYKELALRDASAYLKLGSWLNRCKRPANPSFHGERYP